MGEDLKKIKERIEKLRTVINHYRYLYHVLDRQDISDEALDSLKYELANLESQYPRFVTPDSPTQRVAGRALDRFEKVHHEVTQWSFNDAFSEEDIRAFDTKVKRFLMDAGARVGNNIPYTTELKIDGFKIVLTYEKGLLKTAATRGDGIIGENVTMNIKTMESIPLKLEESVNVVVEGEVWMGKKDFEKLNRDREKNHEPLYANPRNFAAGTIRQLDPKIVAERKLQAFMYDIGRADFVIPDSQTKELEKIKSLGFKVNKHHKLCSTIDEVISYWKYWQKKAADEDYWIDGVVVKIDSRKWQDLLGYTGKAPRFGIAFKFRAKQATTKLLNISIQVGRTGVLTPVANLAPVQLAGTTVSHATLHNEDEIKRLDLRIGDTVIIEKAGDIIPNVTAVLKEMRIGDERAFHFPKKCPVCGSDVVRLPGEAAHKCINKKCLAKERRRLYYFTSKSAFDIDHLGPKVIDQLADAGLVSSPADLFDLKVDDVQVLPRFGERSADNLIKAIGERKKISLPRFIISLGIPQVGEETAYDIARCYNSVHEIAHTTKDELMKINGVGDVVADSIINWFEEPANKILLEKLLARIYIERVLSPASVEKLPLSGKTFVFTGTMPVLGRNEAKSHVRKLGGDVGETISGETSYLVAGDSVGSKYNKAKKIGLKIIDEKEFLKLIGYDSIKNNG